MPLVRCPWCGPRDAIEFRYGGQAHIVYPPIPTPPPTRSGRISCSCATTHAVRSGSLVPRPRVSRGSTPCGIRRHTEVFATYRIDEEPPGVTARRLPRAVRSSVPRPLAFRFDGADEGFQGDTLASALLANGVIGGFRCPISGGRAES